MARPIYIAGRAHSGSTFLNLLLNHSPAIKGCGGIPEAWESTPQKCVERGESPQFPDGNP